MLSSTSILMSNIADARSVVDMAKYMAGRGYRRVWLAENNILDAVSVAGAIVTVTDLEVGTAIVPAFSRSPVLLGMTAATLSRLGGGRPVHLGIGAGGQIAIERWHGVPFEKTVDTVGDTIAILRQVLAGERTDLTGTARRSSGFRLAGQPSYAARIYVGGMGPRMQALAARAADGLILTWLSPRIIEVLARDFGSAVVAADRDRTDVDLVARAYVCVCDDPDAAREHVRRELVEYLLSPPYARYFASVGFADDVAAVRAGYEARDRARSVAGVSDALLDEVLICGRDAADITEPLRAYFDAGADQVMVQPVPAERAGDPARTIAAVADAMS